MASRLLRGTGAQRSRRDRAVPGDSFAHWALRRHRPAPRGVADGGKGAWPQLSWTPGHMELQAQGTEGGGGCLKPRLRVHSGTWQVGGA